MMILRLKNLTNIYRIDANRIRREDRGYLALEDLRIKSKFTRSNMPIREVWRIWRSGETKNPRGRRKKRKKARAGRLGPGLKHKLSAIHPSAELGAKIYGTELGAKIYGVELGARDAGAQTC